MKKFTWTLVLVLVFILGISCGGLFQLTIGADNSLEIGMPKFVIEAMEENKARQEAKKAKKEEELRREKELLDKINAEKEASESEVEEDEPQLAPGEKSITNPYKVCDTEGCGRAVFVEYHGKQLCTKCYAKIKNSEPVD